MSVEGAKALIAKINKTHPGAVLLASEVKVARRYTAGDLSLDVALGGGWPANRWIEILGLESAGKTWVIMKTIAANQKADPKFTTFWLAAEPYDEEQAEALGVDNSRVILYPTREMEEAFEQLLAFTESREVDCLVLDSYPAMIADEEADKGMDEATMAIGARLFGKFFRKVGTAGHRDLTDPTDAPFLGFVVNQYRDAIGSFSPHGTPKTSPGGKAKNYGFWVRADIRRDEFITESREGKGKVVVGQTIKIKTIKNKSTAPQQVASIDLYFRDAPTLGFKRGDYDEVKSIFIMGVLFDVIARRGAYYQWENGEEKDGKPLYRWQGKDATLQAIRENVDLREGITAAVLETIKNHDLDHSITEEANDAATNSGTRKVTRRRAK